MDAPSIAACIPVGYKPAGTDGVVVTETGPVAGVGIYIAVTLYTLGTTLIKAFFKMKLWHSLFHDVIQRCGSQCGSQGAAGVVRSYVEGSKSFVAVGYATTQRRWGQQ